MDYTVHGVAEKSDMTEQLSHFEDTYATNSLILTAAQYYVL